ncbi:glycosyltransferase [Vagococcus xieshaowenii]|uniref:Glycosyltransferase n=1 Tax=Vagococcus xieshaowenii TaxID=2562451 RepID=A0AAJ5EH95_9ENTE|nr:glycosyltransferase [Vagococcus xieshaowenii]QCA29261.1 glycosyltransferase [Vagococcus xieshaowenii]TFZ43185.1 glycosyltransferase [Vagococcus xieshaowenii]
MNKESAKEIIAFGKSHVNGWRNKRTRELGNYYKALNHNKIVDNCALFESYHAVTTTGNIYAIYQQLCKEKPDIQKYWVYITKNPLTLEIATDKNTHLVKYESKEYFQLLATAKYLFNDTSFMPYFVKRSDQIYINTWHGTPLKTLGKDIINAGITNHKNIQRNILSTDYLMMPNHFTAEKLITAHDCNGILPAKVFITGNPRVDRNFLNRETLLKRYDLPKDKKILLYAPTWKKEAKDTTEDDIKELISQIDQLQTTLGDDTKVLLKSHYFIFEAFVKLGFSDAIVPDWVDTNEYLGLVDGLITDYSSIFFDYLPNNKPVYFYMPDLEEYKNVRGLYLDVENLPGNVYYEFDDLLQGVTQPEAEYMAQSHLNREYYMKEFCSFDDGQSAKRIIDIVFNKNENYESVSFKNNKKTLAFYTGGLFNNGITTSLINLTKQIDYDKYEVIIFDFDNIARYAEKQTNLARLDKRVKVIYKFGRVPFSFKANVAKDLFLRQGAYGKNVKIDEVSEYYQTDFRRAMGNFIPDVIIDFGGYNKVMNALIGFSPAKKKILFYHTLVEEEYNKMVNNRYTHRWNLKIIFSMYNYFDEVVSVSDSAAKENQQAIKRYSPKANTSNMKTLENLVNGDDIVDNIEEGEQLNLVYHGDGLIVSKKTTSNTVSQMTMVNTLDKESIHFVSAARMSPEKNHIMMIKAFKQVAKHTPNIKLHLLGSGPIMEDIRHTILSEGLENNVYLYGHLDAPHYLISQCDAAVLFSQYEGQGLFILEAMITGLPVIGTNVPGIQSVIDSGKNGLLVSCDMDGMVTGFNAYINGQVPKAAFDYKQYNQAIMDKFESLVNN